MCNHWTDVRQSLVPDGCMRVPLLQPKRDMGACREVHLHHHHPHYGRYIVGGLALAGAYEASRSCYWMKVRAERLDSRYWWTRYHDCIGD